MQAHARSARRHRRQLRAPVPRHRACRRSCSTCASRSARAVREELAASSSGACHRGRVSARHGAPSHYFYASLPHQFDELCWFDETRAVTPLAVPQRQGAQSSRNLSLRALMSVKVKLQHALAAVFRPFTKVHPQEAATVGLMTVSAFMLLTAYYLLKTVREPLILLQGGAEVKLYARAGQAVLMVGVVHLYGELARRVGRMKLLTIVFLFFISNLAVFTVLAKAGRADRPAVLPVGGRVQLHDRGPVLGAGRGHLHRRTGQAPVPDHRRRQLDRRRGRGPVRADRSCRSARTC